VVGPQNWEETFSYTYQDTPRSTV